MADYLHINYMITYAHAYVVIYQYQKFCITIMIIMENCIDNIAHHYYSTDARQECLLIKLTTMPGI